jgi:hypothetical protein
VHHCTTCTAFAPEILKIIGDRPKVSKSGLKRSTELRKLPKAEMPRGYYGRWPFVFVGRVWEKFVFCDFIRVFISHNSEDAL